MEVIKQTNKQFTKAKDVQIPDIYFRKYKTGINGLDEAFGGQGFLPGAVITLAAPAGVGKTVMSLQLLQALEDSGKRTAFISGEESIEQISFNCKRLDVVDVPIANIIYIEDIVNAVIKEKLDFVVLDSYPTIKTRDNTFKSVREKESYIINKLVTLAKEHEVTLLIIQHCTKDGKYKGSTELVHAVDAQFSLQKNPDDYNLRDLIAHKNRFGCCSFMTFEFGINGYNFDFEQQTEQQQQQKTKKTSKADVVLNVLNSAKTAAEIVKETEISGAYLTMILRDLVTQGKAIKDGRGAQATYIKNS